MATNKSAPFHAEHPRVVLPHAVPGPGSFQVTELPIQCRQCSRPLSEPHGTATDGRDYTDFIIAAHCARCRCATQARLRIFSDGRILHYSDTAWGEQIALSRWDRFVLALRRFLNRKLS